jgi:site-specific recombinase XerD
MTASLGQIVHSFFEDHLKVQKGLRPATIRSYGDTVRLFLNFVAKDVGRPITSLPPSELTFERTLAFLRHIEEERGNHVRTRNQRRAALRTFFDYLGSRLPELLVICERVAAIAVKRAPPPETHFLELNEITSLLKGLPRRGRHWLRDRSLLLFLYNTGARAQEVAGLLTGQLELGPQPRVHLLGKGDKWRSCPLWKETTKLLRKLLDEQSDPRGPGAPVFCSRPGVPLTRFGIYKIVRRHASHLDIDGVHPRRVSPHLLRHTAAVHLLESGVEVNVIRAWLGHVSLDTTNKYAELTIRAKQEAVRMCEPPLKLSGGDRPRAVWKDDKSLLAWLSSL